MLSKCSQRCLVSLRLRPRCKCLSYRSFSSKSSRKGHRATQIPKSNNEHSEAYTNHNSNATEEDALFESLAQDTFVPPPYRSGDRTPGLPQRPIMVHASEVGALLGVKQMPSQSNIFLDTFERVYTRTETPLIKHLKEKWQAEKRKFKMLTEVQALEAITPRPVKNYIEKTMKSIENETLSTTAAIQKLSKEIRKNVKEMPSVKRLTEDEKKSIEMDCISQVRRKHGIEAEKPSLQILSQISGWKIHGNNERFYALNMGTVDNNDGEPVRNWMIGGRIDGFANGELIEIKNRTRAFIHPVPLHERMQIELYMRLLDLSYADLIEFVQRQLKVPKKGTLIDPSVDSSLAPEVPPEFLIQQARTRLYCDDKVWYQTMVPLMDRFVHLFQRFVEDENAQLEYWNAQGLKRYKVIEHMESPLKRQLFGNRRT